MRLPEVKRHDLTSWHVSIVLKEAEPSPHFPPDMEQGREPVLEAVSRMIERRDDLHKIAERSHFLSCLSFPWFCGFVRLVHCLTVVISAHCVHCALKVLKGYAHIRRKAGRPDSEHLGLRDLVGIHRMHAGVHTVRGLSPLREHCGLRFHRVVCAEGGRSSAIDRL